MLTDLENVLDCVRHQYECFVNNICQIIFEGENTDIGRQVTIDRIKELACYSNWLEDEWNTEI